MTTPQLRIAVTGASRGIGRAIVETYLQQGAHVAAASRSASQAFGDRPEVVAIDVDLGDPGGATSFVEQAIERLGGLDVLVNNVGEAGFHTGTIDELSDEAWDRAWSVNFMSAVAACRAARSALVESSGAIINVASVNARLPAPQVVPYSCAKAALVVFGKALATELAPLGVRVNTVAPGPVDTDMWHAPDGAAATLADALGVEAGQVVEATAASMPIGRFATAEEVAQVVGFFASPAASAVTGAVVPVDGGLLPMAW